MKKLSLILIFTVLLATLFAISIFADGNITNQATVTTSAKHWHVVGNGGWAKDTTGNIADGNYETGIPACAGSRLMYVYFEFETEQQIEKIILHCNGSAQAGNIGYWSNINANRNIGIYVHDANGKLVFEQWHNTLDKTELLYIPESVVVGKKVTLRFDSDYTAEYALLRELEIHSHTCLFDEQIETIKDPTCIENGVGIFECQCGKTEEQPILATGIHNYIEYDLLSYDNGFLSNGIANMGCPTCDDYMIEETLPIFKFLGYSVSRSGKSICVSYVVEKEALNEYEIVNETTLSYGIVLAVSDSQHPISSDGAIANGINAQAKSLYGTSYPRFDIKMSASNWESIADTPLIMCAYLIDGDNVSYICSETNTENAIPFSYNQINLMPIA